MEIKKKMQSCIPQEALRYRPSGERVFIGSGKSIIRFIFYKIEFTDYENQKLVEFKKYLVSQNASPEVLQYNDEELLRTIIGCKFAFKKALDAIHSAMQWRSSNLPNG